MSLSNASIAIGLPVLHLDVHVGCRQELWVPQCYSMTAEGLLTVARGSPKLRDLNLRGNPLSEDDFTTLISHLPGLTSLQVGTSSLIPLLLLVSCFRLSGCEHVHMGHSRAAHTSRLPSRA